MTLAHPLTFTDAILDFLASTPTLEQIVAFHPTPELEARSHYLHERNRQDALTDAEHIEFEDLRRMNHFMNQLKMRARLHGETKPHEGLPNRTHYQTLTSQNNH